jgi:hypothetical protein
MARELPRDGELAELLLWSYRKKNSKANKCEMGMFWFARGFWGGRLDFWALIEV